MKYLAVVIVVIVAFGLAAWVFWPGSNEAEAEPRLWRWCDVQMVLPTDVWALPAGEPGLIDINHGNAWLTVTEDGETVRGETTPEIERAVHSLTRVGTPPDAWPYTSDYGNSVRDEDYRQPDPASGIIVATGVGDDFQGNSGKWLEVRSCNSEMIIPQGGTGLARMAETDFSGVTPEDLPAFQRFAEEAGH